MDDGRGESVMEVCYMHVSVAAGGGGSKFRQGGVYSSCLGRHSGCNDWARYAPGMQIEWADNTLNERGVWLLGKLTVGPCYGKVIYVVNSCWLVTDHLRRPRVTCIELQRLGLDLCMSFHEQNSFYLDGLLKNALCTNIMPTTFCNVMSIRAEVRMRHLGEPGTSYLWLEGRMPELTYDYCHRVSRFDPPKTATQTPNSTRQVLFLAGYMYFSKFITHTQYVESMH